jgi:hypothetical protein
MRKFRQVGAALVVAGVMSSGMLHAAGPGTGGGRSNEVICNGLAVLYNGALQVGADAYAASVKDYAASIGCTWAQ